MRITFAARVEETVVPVNAKTMVERQHNTVLQRTTMCVYVVNMTAERYL